MPKAEGTKPYAEIKLPDTEARERTQEIFTHALVSSSAAADRGARGALALTFTAWLAVAPLAEPLSRVLSERESEKRTAGGAAIALAFIVGLHAAFCRGGAMSAYTRAKRLGVHEAVLSAHVVACELFAPFPYAVLLTQLGLMCLTVYILGFAFDTVAVAGTPSLLHLIFMIGSRWGRTKQWRQEFEMAQIEHAERPAWIRRLARHISSVR